MLDERTHIGSGTSQYGADSASQTDNSVCLMSFLSPCVEVVDELEDPAKNGREGRLKMSFWINDAQI